MNLNFLSLMLSSHAGSLHFLRLILIDIIVADTKSLASHKCFTFFIAAAVLFKVTIDNILGRLTIMTKSRIASDLWQRLREIILSGLILQLIFLCHRFAIIHADIVHSFGIHFFLTIDSKITVNLRVIQRVARIH